MSTPRWTLDQGESLAVLHALPDGYADAVITDPPYSSGGAFRGDRMLATSAKYTPSYAPSRDDFAGDNRDQRAFAYWETLWLSECLRVAKPGAPICLFTDWRQLPTTTDALQAGGWVWRGIVPWCKPSARPCMGRFTSSTEFIVWGSAGAMPVDRGVDALPGHLLVHVNPAEKHHPTGKPLEVMLALCRICEPGGLILDPFAGSGSTGVAALRAGYRFHGCEILSEHAAVARERLAAEERGSTFEASRAGQLAFGVEP